MHTINDIILHSSHRPWALPTGKWAYYQEWNRVLFMHWKVPANELQSLLPAHLTLDLYDNNAWISLVPFTMEQIRPNGIPAFAPVSNFHEINIRTYVIKDNKPGVYFLNIEAGNYLSARIARYLSGLPYEPAHIQRLSQDTRALYSSRNKKKGFELTATFEPGEHIENKSPIDHWLTERYCLYLDYKGSLYRYDIHHRPWDLQRAVIHDLKVNYRIGAVSLTNPPDLAHYSNGVQVIAWKREQLITQ